MVKPKRLGHVVLKVRDIEKSEQFYTGVLGLMVTAKISSRMVFMSASGDSSHELACMSIGADAPGPESSRVGLYHFAWEMESFEELQEFYLNLKNKKIPISGIGDHGMSIGVYFFDPDGNEIEVFYELPKEQWIGGDAFTGRFPRILVEEGE